MKKKAHHLCTGLCLRNALGGKDRLIRAALHAALRIPCALAVPALKSRGRGPCVIHHASKCNGTACRDGCVNP